MKKGGILSLICYIIYTLLGAYLVIDANIKIDKLNEAGGGFEGIGYAIILVLGIVLGAVGLGGVILKLIHMASGWGFFGFLCVLLDIVFVLAFISMALPGGEISQIGQMELSEVLVVLPFIAASVASAVSNIISMKK